MQRWQVKGNLRSVVSFGMLDLGKIIIPCNICRGVLGVFGRVCRIPSIKRNSLTLAIYQGGEDSDIGVMDEGSDEMKTADLACTSLFPLLPMAFPASAFPQIALEPHWY